MIHVAEAGEAKGRVVVQSSSGQVSPIALQAAVWLARAFQSEIESLYVEREELVALAGHPFAREISLSGRVSRGVDLQEIEREFRFASAEFQRAIAACALAGEVAVRQRIVRDDPVHALSVVCTDCGPWNAVALAEPFTSPSCPSISDLLAKVRDATGVLVVGPQARRTRGPIVVALENGEMLTAMLGAADRLAGVQAAETMICLFGSGTQELAELEGVTRLALAEWPNARLAGAIATHGSEAAMAEALRRMEPGLVMGQFGGLLMSETGNWRPLAASLECPLLLLR